MEVIKIIETDDTPGVILDKENNNFEIWGRSLPEDVNSFFEPIISWFEEYAENPNDKTVLNVKMSYFNTASSKILLDIFVALEDIFETGKDVLVKWFYPADEDDMKEAGEEYEEMIEIPFEHIAYNK